MALPRLPGSRLKRFVRLLFVVRAYTKELSKCIGHYKLRDIAFGARHGFAADRVFLYGRPAIVSGTYLSDLQRQFSRFINPKPVRELLEDKLLFAALVGGLVHVPKNYLYTDNGSVVVLLDEWNEITSCRNPNKTYRLVMKRARGGGGVGVHFVDIRQGSVCVSGQETEVSDFLRDFVRHDEHLLCQFIEQSTFCREIYPHTTNTLRIICMRERGGEPFIAKAIFRIGTRNSNGVDNFGRGGLAAIVDTESGVLSAVVEHHDAAPRAPTLHSRHPDTNTPIAGECLPGWKEANDQALRLMRHLPFINYAGWDIVLTNSGPVFLEGNNYTGVRLAQLQTGLLADPRTRDFYRHYGIVHA
jgi:hypothetical protein